MKAYKIEIIAFDPNGDCDFGGKRSSACTFGAVAGIDQKDNAKETVAFI